MEFVIFAPRTVKTANIHKNTAMIRSRMVGVKISANCKSILYTERKTNVSDSTSSVLLF